MGHLLQIFRYITCSLPTYFAMRVSISFLSRSRTALNSKAEYKTPVTNPKRIPKPKSETQNYKHGAQGLTETPPEKTARRIRYMSRRFHIARLFYECVLATIAHEASLTVNPQTFRHRLKPKPRCSQHTPP